MDVAQRKVLWCVTERKGYVHHCTLNQNFLSYIQHVCKSPDSPCIDHVYQPPDSLRVLNVLTGVLKSSTKLPQQISGREITEVQAHPVRELIFITFSDEILVFSTTTTAWVGVLRLPILFATDRAITVDPSSPPPKVRKVVLELRFDECGRGSGARNTISVCKVADFIHLGKLKRRCWVIYHFEFPMVEELEADNAETSEEILKLIVNWKPIVDIIGFADATVSGHPWINLRSKQTGEFLRYGSSRCTKVFISTFKEAQSAPEHLEGIQLARTNLAHQFSARDKGKGKGKEAEAEVKWFLLSDHSEVTKMKKDLPKDTPYAERRMPFCFSSSRQSESPQLSERYLIVDQGWEILLFSFEPAW